MQDPGVPDQGLNLCPEVEARNLHHWTTRKVSNLIFNLPDHIVFSCASES